MVETCGRLAQWRTVWRTDNLGTDYYDRPIPCNKRSDIFKMGIWDWHLLLENGSSVSLYCKSSEGPPHARFFLRVTVPGAKRTSYTSPIHEGPFLSSDKFSFSVDGTYQGQFIIDVEFLDLKISPSDGGDDLSVWPSEDTMRRLSTRGTLKYFSRMLNESLFSDITINTSDGKLQAHRAILSASSPVFHSMFVHDLREKQSSTIDITDMTSETCTALLGYMYGTISNEEFSKQRLALLATANKYDIPDLKDVCEESLLEDIGVENVLERLQEAWLYQLDRLKKGCMTYLFDFGKIHDLGEEMNDFLKRVDGELVEEMFKELVGHLEHLQLQSYRKTVFVV